jgi:hypothetical protein
MLSAPGKGGGLATAALLVFLLLALPGCGSFFLALPRAESGPERLRIPEVPFYPQEEYQCGPAALAMLLAWSGRQPSLAELTPEVYSPTLRGSLQPALVAAARRHGRLAYPLAGREALLAELAAGHPVLILQNLGLSWFPRWHYAVVIGFDRAENKVFLHSGSEEGLAMSARVFANTWQRAGAWGLLVLPPGRLPATATEASYLAAVLGLEQAGQWQAAALAHGAAVERWPENFLAWLGLGNSLYALGDAGRAAEAFAQALALCPDSAPALNNLALALAAMGRRQEALRAIEQAIELGGEFRAEFLRSREEILAPGGAGPGEMVPDLPK